MQPFIKHRGLVVGMDRADVDTDQVIPKQFLKRIERSGFGQFLFFDWRFLPGGEPNPDFELNQPGTEGCSILLARDNFGCGSSREHAVWALADYGILSVIAPSFADIFFNNCFKNGVLPVVLEPAVMDQLFTSAALGGYQLTVDLEARQVRDDEGLQVEFSLDPFRRQCLLEGLDDIALTLHHEDRITAYEQSQG
jgi:3-isopropylmalate/(R)-2-methylmalate dehydratase small subunit